LQRGIKEVNTWFSSLQNKFGRSRDPRRKSFARPETKEHDKL
jgi:hypothetical protein